MAEKGVTMVGIPVRTKEHVVERSKRRGRGVPGALPSRHAKQNQAAAPIAAEIPRTEKEPVTSSAS